jgi:hypothetical protein
VKSASHLTQGYEPVLARQISLTAAGMAHFAATGPFGTKCSDCAFFGYWRQVQNAAGEIATTKFRRRGCHMFFKLTGRHGPEIPGETESCRHFQRRQESSRAGNE